MTFSYGDGVELIALACFTVAAFLALHVIGALIVAGICLFYLAQDPSHLTFSRPKLPARLRRSKP
jgi:hypothetical protein